MAISPSDTVGLSGFLMMYILGDMKKGNNRAKVVF
jgi:hypothetical protein